MGNEIFIEKSLKRFIKLKKVGYTTSLLVGFLITGNILYAENISITKEAVEQKIKENNKRIEEVEKRTVELLREGDYYAKTLEDNKQFFFPLNYEHRHASKGEGGIKIIPGIPIIPPGEPGGPTETIPGIPIVPPGKPGGPIIKPEVDIPDKIEVTIPSEPTMPEKDITNVEMSHSKLPNPKVPQLIAPNITINENMTVPEFVINKPEKVEIHVGGVEIDKYVTLPGVDDNKIGFVTESLNLNIPIISHNYNPDYANNPELFDVPELKAPNDVNLPEIDIVIESFAQGSGGIITHKEGATGGFNQSAIENYGNYKVADGETLKITFSDDVSSKENKISYEGLENFQLVTGKGDSVEVEKIKKLREKFYGYIHGKEWIGKAAAFISNTAPGNSTVSGNYEINYDKTDYNEKVARIFLSINPAGIGGNYGHYNYDKWGNANGGAEGNNLSAEEKRKAKTTFDGEITLTNQTENGTLLGIDHQLWDTYVNGSDEWGTGGYDFLKSYSVAENSGKINLGKSSEDKNLVGISIEQERETQALQKLNNHVTLNKGEININGHNNIGIAYETGVKTSWENKGEQAQAQAKYNGKIFAHDLYVGNINFGKNSKNSYGVRLKRMEHYNGVNPNLEFTDKHKYDNTRIFGSISDNIGGVKENLEGLSSGKVNKISVRGNNNGGFVVAQSLNSSAERYLIKDETGNDINKGDDPTVTNPNKPIQDETGKIIDYTGMFNGDIKVKDKQGNEIAFKGYEKGKVDPIANIHGLNIEVDGTSSVGFLRHKDYSKYNENDMVITNTSTSAIKDIDFGKNVSGSVLIRSDMYGIKVEKDLTVDGDGTEGESKESNSENAGEKQKNIILQATKSIWAKTFKETGESKNVKSVGNITNSGNLKSSMDSVIGMMSNDGEKPENVDFKDVEGLNGYTEEKAEIKNTGDITLTGKNVIGMAVLDDNLGILENGKVDTTMEKTEKADENPENITEIKDYNVSIYNDGEFNIKNSEILTSGKGSVALYNTGDIKLETEQDKENKITANDGAVALYSKGGTVNSTGKLNINSENNGIGIYAVTYKDEENNISKGAAVSITDGNINVSNGATGVASVGEGTNVTLNDSQLTYSGNGYALYDENKGKININNSTINLNGKAVGMKVTWGQGNNNITFDSNSKIVVDSDDVIVFNIVADGENKLNSNLSNLKTEIGTQLGNVNIDNLVQDGKSKNYKDAMVDGGNLTIDKNISKNDEENTDGGFYFKKFLGQRLNTTVDENVKINAELNNETAGNFYDGKVTGLEIVSSKFAKSVDEASLTLSKGAEITANRLDGEQKKGSATVGVFSNYGKINLENGSIITVENEKDSDTDKSYQGVGVFAVNGSVVDAKGNINVHGDKSVGIYAKAYRTDEDGKIVKDEFGENALGQGKINVTNIGDITLTGDGSVGIYANNNSENPDKSNSKVINEGKITTGVSNETSSIGIYGAGTTINNIGEIIVTDSEKIGGVGIFAVQNSVIENIGDITLGTNSFGVITDGEITNTADVKFNSTGTEGTRVGFGFEKDRTINFNIDGSGVDGLRAIAMKNGELTLAEGKTITIGEKDSRGIVVTEGKAINKGTINIGKEGVATEPNDKRSIGMTAMNKDGIIDNTKGTININSSKEIGIYIHNDGKESIGNTLADGDAGTINLNGKNNIGVYIANGQERLNLNTLSDGINFGDNSSDSTAVYLKNTNIETGEINRAIKNGGILLYTEGGTVTNSGNFIISSGNENIDENTNRPIGIVLADENAKYVENGNGNITAAGGAIGIYSVGGKTFENLDINVDAQGKTTIGLALKGSKEDGKINGINLAGTTNLHLKNVASSDLNVDESPRNAIGIITEKTNLNIEDLKLNYEESSGIGVYLKDDAGINSGKITITGSGEESKKFSIGVFANEKAKDFANVDFDISKDNSIGLFTQKDNFVYEGTENKKAEITISSKNSIGIITDKNLTVGKNTVINVKGGTETTEGSGGVAAYNGSVTNLGTIYISNEHDVALLGENSNITNSGTINAEKGMGVYVSGEKTFDGAGGKITADGKTGTAITLVNGAGVKNGLGTLELKNGATGIYLENSVIDGNNFVENNKTIDLTNSDSKAVGIIIGKSEKVDKKSQVKNISLKLGEEGTGVVVLDNAAEVNNIKIESDADNTTGIYIKSSTENQNEDFKFDSIDINMKDGFGIVVDKVKNGGNSTLTLENSAISILDSGEKRIGAGVYVGEGNTFISAKNTYTMLNNVGIYGKSGSSVNLKEEDKMFLLNNSTGIFLESGKVNIEEGVEIGNLGTDTSSNNAAVYIKNGGTLESGADISALATKDSYGLILEGQGSITNTGNITAVGSSNVGIAFIGAGSDNEINNSGTIDIKEEGENTSFGIYSTGADINNNNEIKITDRGIGILSSNVKNSHNLLSKKITLAGNNSIGAFLEHNFNEIKFENISGENIQDAIGIYMTGVTNGDLNTKLKADNISLGNNSVGMYFDSSYVNAEVGSVTVGNITDKEKGAIGVYIKGNGSNTGDVTLDITNKISAGENGTAVFNQNGTVKINGVEKLETGKGNGALIHSDGGKVVLATKEAGDSIILKADGHYGFILGGEISADDDLKNKDLTIEISQEGTGIIFGNPNSHKEEGEPDVPFEKANIDIGLDRIVVDGGTNDTGYTKGIYYHDLGNIGKEIIDNNSGEKIDIIQKGMNTIGIILDKTSGNILTDIEITKEAKDSIGMVVRRNGHNWTTITGNISVEAGGILENNTTSEKFGNMGLEVYQSDIATRGDITVGEGHKFENSYPVGVYLKNEGDTPESSVENMYVYEGIGNLTVGNFATGIAGRNYNVSYDGDIKAGVGAVGIFVENIDYKAENFIKTEGNIIVGDNSLPERVKGTGIYGKNTNIEATGDMNILANTGNIGIVGTEKGDIKYKGNVNISGNENSKIENQSIIGIYKKGNGNINISEGKWNIGENSIGVAGVSQDSDKINITNESDMEIRKGGVGIYSSGSNTLINNGDLKVEGGAEKGNSSAGIYMENDGVEKSLGTNKGIINVLNEGIGMYAVNGAVIKNGGTINLGDADGIGSLKSVGIYGKGNGTSIINDGTINANHGTGMYVTDGASLFNNGDINIKNGIGIKGNGILVNNGNIHLEKGYTGIEIDKDTENLNNFDSIININNNIAEIESNYIGTGGTLDSDFDLKLKNPTVDITKGELGFNAPNISGGIKPSADFIQKGNGYSFDVKDFAKDDVNLDVNTSPLFEGEITKGDLSINKVDYKDILKDYEYKEFYNALDETLKTGISEDIDAIKNLNMYLESFGNSPEFYEQYNKTMGETRGSIYSHIQGRMQDIERSFNNAFDEMESSYSLSKDTDKFSVIYTEGDYKNRKSQIPDYDYRITGLLYMKEYEDTDAKDKYGYSYGFTGSRFKFEDTGRSKENVYSLKGGVHNVKYFSRDLNLLTKFEAGINYHETDRTLAFGPYKYENNSDFWSYQISFDNKFRKILYENYQNEFGAYLGFETEYGRFTDIKEDGTLALKIKGNDYLSAKAVSGFNGTGRKYLGNDWTGKITGDIGYSYDFGHNYKENESRLKNSGSGYTSIMSEVETRGKVTGKIGIGVERLNYLGVTLEGEVSKDFERDEDYWRVGLRFNYKFNIEDPVTTLRNTFNLFNNHFDFDKDDLKEREKKIVEVGSRIIDKYDLKGTLVLEGHTDSYGSLEYNQGLSERRAERVKKELSSQIKKSENIKYKTKGYSELKPVDTNETPEGRANNRRTEVKFLSNKKR